MRNHITMLPLLQHGQRGSYASAACPGGVNYCDSATAWASCCYDIPGTYSISPQTAFKYLKNEKLSDDECYSFLYLMNRESSFTPDVIAHCPPCCCTEAGVDAVGLLQIVIQAWPQFSVDFLKDPQNNCYAANFVYQRQGWNAWSPLNAALEQSTRDYWRSVVGSSSGSGSEPGISVASDIIAGPSQPQQPQIAAAPQATQLQLTTQPIPVTYTDNPAPFDSSLSGWEAVTRYFTNDIPYYTGYDQHLTVLLNQILETQI